MPVCARPKIYRLRRWRRVRGARGLLLTDPVMACLYVLVMLSVLFAAAVSAEYFKRLDVPVVLCTCIFACTNLYLGSLLPGVLGFYAPFPVALATISSAAFAILFFCKKGIDPRELKFGLPDWGCNHSLHAADVCLLSAGSLLLIPFFNYAATVVASLSPEAGYKLGWDVVSYHLPALVEFQQAHSLWSENGPYQSFSFGFELIYGLSMLFFKQHWGMPVGVAVSLVVMCASLMVVTKQLCRSLPKGLTLNTVPITIFATAIFFNISAQNVNLTGKNDVFVAACLLSTLGLLMLAKAGFADSAVVGDPSVAKAFDPAEASGTGTIGGHGIAAGNKIIADRHNALLVLAAFALGLAFATKPPAFIFLPLFAFMAGVPSSKIQTLIKNFQVRWALAFTSGALLIGGFFTFRNLVCFGKLANPRFGFLKGSVLRSLDNPHLYSINIHSVLFCAGMLTPIFLIFLWQRNTERSYNSPLLWSAAFYLFGLLGFLLTPWAVWDSGTLAHPSPYLDDRKALCIYGIASCAFAIFCAIILPKLLRIKVSALAAAVACVCLLPASVVLNEQWCRYYPTGLPGFEEIKGLRKTNVYSWVQTSKYQRIYAAGLRPYGLYDQQKTRSLFYDLASGPLNREGSKRLLAIMFDFNPDLILISVDPHVTCDSMQKPDLVKWMRSQPCFTEVFNDEAVSGFEVRNDWRQHFGNVQLASKTPRMGG